MEKGYQCGKIPSVDTPNLLTIIRDLQNLAITQKTKTLFLDNRRISTFLLQGKPKNN
jgi:hypothetical protein